MKLYFFYFFFEFCFRFYVASAFIYNLNTLIICNTYNIQYLKYTILEIYLYNSEIGFFQNIPQKRPSKNSPKRLPKIRDHPSAANYSAPSHRIGLDIFPKHPPKKAIQEFPKTTSQDSRPSFEKIQKIGLDIFPKHPPKKANQEFSKTTSQDSRPFLYLFADL
jgi:hypothetical protein